MFSFRTIIWVLLIIFLLPADEKGKKELYNKVHAAANMVGGACNKVDACANFDPSWNTFAKKAQTGVDLIAQFIEADDSPKYQQRPQYSAQRTYISAPRTEATQATRQNTLEISDLIPAWRSPEVKSYASR